MSDRPSVYEDLDVPIAINGVGTKTRISGTLMRPEAADAMREAATAFVRISDLQGRASERIADATGAEAGYVASGAAACLTLAAAAAIAGDDLDRMARLPETDGVADKIVMPRTHRNGYDHALRAAGATVVDVGNNDKTLGSGAANVELWEIEAAIDEETAAIGYMQKPYIEPPLADVADLAHEHDLPVIVDAAAELPPTRNLERFVDEGADLVAFSGGKAVRGPQSTGFLAGREDLVQSAALQHLDMHAVPEAWIPTPFFDGADLPGTPRQGIGRPLKVGKEELVGLIRALELFVEEDDEAVLREWHERAEGIASRLRAADAFSVSLDGAGKTEAVTSVAVDVDEDAAGTTTAQLVRDLRAESPRVYVGADDVGNARFTVNPRCLTDDEAEYLTDRVLDRL
jgi:L-seryl-tRNA(Ser) seleniumtransferase